MLKKSIFLTTTMISGALCSMTSFAGDKAIYDIFNKSVGELSDKPNTGDTNIMLLYGAIAVIALVALIVVNVKGNKKKIDTDTNTEIKPEENNENNKDNE